MRDWSTYNASSILNGTDENGNRLVLEFAIDYKALVGGDLCISCRKSFPFQFNKFLNYFGMKENKTGYVLHTKYNGLVLAPVMNDAISNARMTEEKALRFITGHPKGRALFKKLPKDINDRIDTYKNGSDKEEKFNVHIANGEALKAYAKENNIDLAEATKVKDIREAIKAAM